MTKERAVRWSAPVNIRLNESDRFVGIAPTAGRVVLK